MITMLVIGSLVAFLAMGVLKVHAGMRTQTVAQKKTLMAEALASELLEFFRAQTTKSLRNQLRKNPVTNTTANPYYLCSHINLLDRTKNMIVNEDPIAQLSSTLLDGASKANRFYQVFVVDAATLTINSSACNLTAASIFVSGETPSGTTPYTLTANERFMVTVGVSWGKDKRVVSSILIPN